MLTYVFDDDVFEFPESFIGHPEVYGSKEAAAILGMKKKKNSAQHKENARDIFAWRHNFAKVCGESSCISFLLYLGAAKTSKSSFWDRRKKRIEPEFLPEFQKYA